MQTYLFSVSLIHTIFKKRLHLLCGWIFILISLEGHAQDTIRARKNLNTLSSKTMHGRGYLFKGHEMASQYIAEQMKVAGLETLGSTYFQDFTISQNLFRKEPKLVNNGRKMKAGIDFIPSADCGSISGKFKTIAFDSLPETYRQLGPKHANKKEAWLFSEAAQKRIKKKDWSILEEKGPGLLIFSKSKLTHTLSENKSNLPVIQILGNENIKNGSEIEIKIRSKVNNQIKTRNVIGFSKGNQSTDSTIVLCAHYDHLGAMGKNVFFPGANDNASGVSMLLEMAYLFASRPHKYNMLFIAFGAEEAGLLGSYYFVNHPLVALSSIKFVLNLDLMGFGDKGITVVNGSIFPAQYELMQKINAENQYLTAINARGKAANSDHYPFSERGVPAFFVYTLGGPGYYHDVFDKPETVTFSKYVPTFRLLTEFINKL